MTSTSAQNNFYTAEQVRELDRRAIASGMPGLALMTAAGNAAFRLLRDRWPDCASVEVFCGGGNNGGDGYIVAALAQEAGMAVQVWAMTDSLKGDALSARDRAVTAGVKVTPWRGELPEPSAVVVDAMLGTGLSGALRAPYDAAIDVVNQSGCRVLAIDIPSGLCSDTGRRIGSVVCANATISFIGLKLGLATGAAANYVGSLLFNDLGVPDEIYDEVPPVAVATDLPRLLARLGRRPRCAHKGMFGHVLIVGGDHGMAGAAVLAASAAARSGAGLISCATRPENVAPVLCARPEVMARGVETLSDLDAMLARASVVAIGPGLGSGNWGRNMLRRVLDSALPVVLDADALNLVAAHGLPVAGGDAVRVITPHPGEAARLLGLTTAEIEGDRPAAARKLASQTGATVLLKGAGTLIAGRDTLLVNLGGNPGMASGGMGDVLTGVIAALLAQGLDAVSACGLGAAAHTAAADIAAKKGGERGMLASDLIAGLPGVLNP